MHLDLLQEFVVLYFEEGHSALLLLDVLPIEVFLLGVSNLGDELLLGGYGRWLTFWREQPSMAEKEWFRVFSSFCSS